MPRRTNPRDHTERLITEFTDWAWSRARGGPPSEAEEEFATFPSLVRGEILSTIRRLTTGDVRRGDVHDLGNGIYLISRSVGRSHHHVYFGIRGETCIALACTTSRRRRPTPDDITMARRRDETFPNPA